MQKFDYKCPTCKGSVKVKSSRVRAYECMDCGKIIETELIEIIKN